MGARRPDHPNALHNYAFLLHHTLGRHDEAERMYQVPRHRGQGGASGTPRS